MSEEGTHVCPAIYGATNWWSSSYQPEKKLFCLTAFESCDTYRKADEEWRRGTNWMGGATRLADGAPYQKLIRALDIQTGRTVWTCAQPGQAQTCSDVLSTDGDLVVSGADGGAFAGPGCRDRRAALARKGQPGGLEGLAVPVPSPATTLRHPRHP